MKFRKCYIKGFGKIRDLEYDFNDDLNVFFEQNGWGKTTFSVFIKDMLYGMPSSRSKNVLSERQHYRPWDSGNFGGSLSFSTDKGDFRAERTFGDRPSSDSFKLIDEVSGRESNVYSEKLGEEIFGVDRESFDKTIFIGQEDIETGITDRINAKVGNIAEKKYDLDAYESAVKRLDDAAKIYKSRRKTNPGRIDSLNDEIRDLTAKTEEIPTLLQAKRKAFDLFRSHEDEINRLRKEKEELKKKIKERETNAEKSGRLREKKQTLKNDLSTLSKLNLFFKNGVPSDEEFDSKDKIIQKLQMDEKTLIRKKAALLSDEEREEVEQLFKEHTPGEEEIKAWRDQAERLKELRILRDNSKLSDEDRSELQSIRKFFEGRRPSHTELSDALKMASDLSALYGQKKAVSENRERVMKQMDAAEEAGKQGRHNLNTLYVLLFIANLVGAIYIPYLLIPAIVFLFLFIISKINKYNKGRKRAESIQNELDEINQQLKSIEDSLGSLEQKLTEIANEYDLSEEPAAFSTGISKIQWKLDRLEHLEKSDEESLKKNSQALEELSDVQLELYTKLKPYADYFSIDLYHSSDEENLIRKISELSEKKKSDDRERANYDLLNNRIVEETRELSKFFADRDNDFDPEDVNGAEYFSSELSVLRNNANLYNRLLNDVKKINEEVNTLSLDLSSEENESMEELQTRDNELDRKIEENIRFYDQDSEKLSELDDTIAALSDEKDRIEALKTEKVSCEKSLDIIEKAKSYLKTARDRFMEEYMGPIKNGMIGYLDSVDQSGEIDYGQVELDMDLNVRIRSKGLSYEKGYLSEGFKNILSLAVRFSLIDAMYSEEQPFVILDDPFESLDDEKTKKALELIMKQSKKRQIIYFTCHSSRKPE